jgi:prepilin-type N-terminal cleavage/methylation domain-containing protein
MIFPAQESGFPYGKEVPVTSVTSSSVARSRGFSLIELVVVIAIIIIVSAASIPMGLNFVRTYQIQGAGQNVATMMQNGRGQAVKRNTQRGILLNFNFPQAGQYQWTSLDPSPMTGTWDGNVYPNFSPLSYTEGMTNYGAVPLPPNNTLDPDPANGVFSPHGFVVKLPPDVGFDPGAFNALLFRADGSVRAVNAAGGGNPVISLNGVDFQLTVRDQRYDLTRTITISRNGRVTNQP